MLVRDQNLVIDTALLAGRIMIEGGSEIYRVEDTMRRIVKTATGEDCQIFATITGVLITLNGADVTRFSQINKRGIDMEKINLVNRFSRSFQAQELTLLELRRQLSHLDRNLPNFPLWLRILGAGLQGMFLMIIFTQTHDWVDMPLTFIASAIGYTVAELLGRVSRIRIAQEFTASLTLALVTVLGVRMGLGSNINNVLIGAVMPLVPGLPLTNALRDLIEGNLIAGTERAFEAMVIMCSIAAAIAFVLSLKL